MRKPVRKRPLRSKKKEWPVATAPAPKAKKPGQIEFLPLLLLLILPFGIVTGAIQQGWDDAHRPFFALNTQGEIKIEWPLGGFERVSYRKDSEVETLTITSHFPFGGAHKQNLKDLRGLVGYPHNTTGLPECTWLTCFLGPDYPTLSDLIREARERAKLTKETI